MILAWSVLVLLVAAGVPASGEQPQRVAILPFSMNSQQDLSFLQSGIVDMLTSRLTQPGRVEIVNPDTVASVLDKASRSFAAGGTLDETKARIIGANLKADFVLYGSFTLVGENSSIDASMVDVTGQRRTLTLSRQGTGFGDVIPQVNQFAAEINAGIFGRTPSPSPAVAAVPAADPAPSRQVVEQAETERTPGSAFVNLKKDQKGRSFVKLAELKGTLSCLAAGDVDNDGVTEIAVATDSEITILEQGATGLTVASRLPLGRGRVIVGLDIGDINGNGPAELFVTCLSIRRNVVTSSVFEFDGSGYREFLRDESWYYRVVKNPDGKSRLLGQEQGSSPYDGAISEMEWRNDRYLPATSLPMPRGASILSMASGDLLGDGEKRYVYLDQSGKLTLVSPGGQAEWKGSDRLGGSMLHFVLPRKDPDGTVEDRAYLQPRLVVQDMDGDGRPDVVGVKNHELAGEMLSQFRQFQKGNMEIVSWDGLGLSPVYRTAQVAGQIGDFAVTDLDGDGQREMVVSVITKGKGLVWTTPQSAIILYALN
jgi:TolB-like protein